MDGGRGGGADGVKLPPEQAIMEALPGAGGSGAGAWQRGTGLEPGDAEEAASEGIGFDPGEVHGRGRATLRADAGGGALGQRRPDRDLGVHGAALDVERKTVEPGKESASAPQPAGAQGTLRRTGADGRQLPRLAGRARTARVFDEPGGRRHRNYAGPGGRGG